MIEFLVFNRRFNSYKYYRLDCLKNDNNKNTKIASERQNK